MDALREIVAFLQEQRVWISIPDPDGGIDANVVDLLADIASEDC